MMNYSNGPGRGRSYRDDPYGDRSGNGGMYRGQYMESMYGGGEDYRGERGDDRMRMRSRSSTQHHGEAPIVKVIEVLAQSPHSWEDAARRAVMEASKTIRDIRSIYISDMQAVVDNDQIVAFRVNAKVSFALDPQRR